jgi:phi13 family phage major tail protein
MANSGEYRSVIGLDSVYVATVTTDDAASYVAGTPVYFAPALEATIEPTVNAVTQYADDAPYDAMITEGETAITVNVTGLPLETIALITGKVFDAASGRLWDNPSATPPYMALGFRTIKANGSYRYYWFLKGRFTAPKEAATTKGDTPEPKPNELTFTAINTVRPFTMGAVTASVKRVVGDTDTTNFSATSWFSQVRTPAATTPSALALSSSTPADAATGVSVSANQTLTFNNTLPASAIYNVALLAATNAVIVAATYTLDADRKVMTINPDSNLTGSTGYIITYAVTDVYGQTLRGAINFTTV